MKNETLPENKPIAVKLSKHDVRIITDALNMFRAAQQKIDYDNAHDARTLRDKFALYIGVKYIDKDA